ncbi:MAG: hypothetical protein JNL62_03455 [Bryobacterales bacterium]|nr:hypothetical protein [Bryobacterales bacterium]
MVALLLLLVSVPSAAQVVRDLRLYSEFQRIGPFGEWVAVDRGEKQTSPPREVLSPLVARNSHLSLQVAVTADPKTTYFVAVQSNPENVFQWKLYKATFEKAGKHWVPGKLTEDREPFFNIAPDSDVTISKQNTQVFVLDAFVPEATPAGRVRLEVLVKSDTWRVAPMEVRISPVKLPSVEMPVPNTLADVVVRNRKQIEALAATMDPAVRDKCNDFRSQQATLGAEWFLRTKDCFLSALSR